MRRYDVAWKIATPGQSERTGISTVIITEGYSTLDDVPTMLAIKRGCHRDDVTILATREIGAGA